MTKTMKLKKIEIQYICGTIERILKEKKSIYENDI